MPSNSPSQHEIVLGQAVQRVAERFARELVALFVSTPMGELATLQATRASGDRASLSVAGQIQALLRGHAEGLAPRDIRSALGLSARRFREGTREGVAGGLFRRAGSKRGTRYVTDGGRA